MGYPAKKADNYAQSTCTGVVSIALRCVLSVTAWRQSSLCRYESGGPLHPFSGEAETRLIHEVTT